MDDDYLEIHAKEIALAEVNKQVQKFIQKIDDAKVPITDEYTQGIHDGLDWAIRILTKDKSAS
jgi:hypothetical protein